MTRPMHVSIKKFDAVYSTDYIVYIKNTATISKLANTSTEIKSKEQLFRKCKQLCEILSQIITKYVCY